MLIRRKSYQDIMDTLKADLGLECRFTTRVIFINNLSGYMRMVSELSRMADEVVRLSDDAYCAGNDVVPDLQEVLKHIANAKDQNLLLTSVGEYLRFAKSYESNTKCLHAIMTYPAHSSKRVWIPIYAAKDLFQDVVGELPAERYELYELDEEADEFECFVYSCAFAEKSGIVSVQGFKQMYRSWDDLHVSSGFSFSTRKISLIVPSSGNYAVHLIKSPFEFIRQHLRSQEPKLEETLGTDAFWAKLAAAAAAGSETMEDMIKKSLNVASFDAQQIVSSWGRLSSDGGFGKWLLWLWYKLDLPASGDYLGHAIRRAETVQEIQEEIECAILTCVSSPFFDTWAEERVNALKSIRVEALSPAFWRAFDTVSDERTQLKLLSNTTHEERTRIIEIISKALREQKKISDYRSILAEKYPDLLLYFKKSKYLPEPLAEYIQTYKQFKLMDHYDLSISEDAANIDIFEYATRSKILNSIKCARNAYYLWLDGMGIEWIDMLLEKVAARSRTLADPQVQIGMAAIPTITEDNMKKADLETVSEKRNALDSLSHIRDRTDCNYFSIIDEQFGMIGKIAGWIAEIADAHPGTAIVVTADHGMSRMAAKAFHEKQGITPPAGAEVKEYGRVCILPDGAPHYAFSHTYQEGNCLAFREHSHFTCSGYAPGEIHAGAAPEECLVPIILFPNEQEQGRAPEQMVSYRLLVSEYEPDPAGNVVLKIQTTGKVHALAVELGTNTVPGTSMDEDQWSVTLPNLIPGNRYRIRIHLNNVYGRDVESISIKRRGLDVDDDF